MKSNSKTNTTARYTKKLGETPLQAVERFRIEHPQYAQEKIAYAGRLDPMAEGEMLLLVGEACKEREKYLGLDKEYEFEVLLGVSSDTHDILGLTTRGTPEVQVREAQVVEHVARLEGRFEMAYPVFSSKTVEGKPLFLWALEGRLGEIEIPTKEVEVYELAYQGMETLTGEKVRARVEERIARVSVVEESSKELGRDFRRQEVLARWRSNLEGRDAQEFQVLRLRCAASSGTYMRTLAHTLAQSLGCEGLAWSITRTTIGKWDGTRVEPLLDD